METAGTGGIGDVDGKDVRSKLRAGVSEVAVDNTGETEGVIVLGVSINGELRDRLNDDDDCSIGGMEIELILKERDDATERVSDGVLLKIGRSHTVDSGDRLGDVSTTEVSADKVVISMV